MPKDENGATLLRTPLYNAHLKLGARMVPFAGYEMPVQYSGVLEETKAVRTGAGLFDVSHMGQFSVRGARALDEVQKLVSNDLTKLSLGQAQYNMLCNEMGGVIDDLVVYRRSEQEIFICVNASNRAADYKWMSERLTNVTFEDQSDATALIAIQGPTAEKILTQLADPSVVTAVKYYWAVDTQVCGVPCYLSRTGYTGEDGFELYVSANDAEKVWNQLLDVGKKDGLIAAGLGARDTVRLEMGYPLHGHEISPEITPLMAGLGWVVKLNRETPFVGQSALKSEAARGPSKLLRAFVVEDRRIARQGYPVANSKKEIIGEITSGTHSPHVGSPIALGFVDKSCADEDRFYVRIRDQFVPMRTVKLPFVPSRTKRNVK